MDQPPQEAEEKAVELENILVTRLEASIKGSTPWSRSFSRCKDLLMKKLEGESHPDRKFRVRFRRKVHNLNDLLAEHHSIFNNANVVFAWRLRNIKNEIQSSPKDKVKGADPRPLIESQTERVPRRPSSILEDDRIESQMERVPSEVDQMAVENLLLCRDTSPEFNAVGIYGAEGLGKTALAKVVFRSEKVKARFLPRIWICLTDRRESEKKDSDEIFVAKRILLHLGIDLQTVGEGSLVEVRRAIHTELKRKRYLVALDGVTEEMEPAQMKRVMAMLRDALPRGTGGAVVVTGRAEKMVKAMVGDADGVYQLQPNRQIGTSNR